MKIKVWIMYEESYLPPRCRKPRYRECEEHVFLTLPEASISDFRLAFEDSSYLGAGKIYFYKKHLWRLATIRDRYCRRKSGEGSPLQNLIETMDTCSMHFHSAYDRETRKTDTSRDAVICEARKNLREFLLVDGVLYIQTKEPRYCIYTFGLGHNHGGTSLSVDYCYNPNISKKMYFSALHGKEAVEEATRIALRRGDTESVQDIKEEITVFAPDLVKVNPSRQHGKGNPILNNLNDITECAPDALIAGLLCIASTSFLKGENYATD